MSASSVDKVDPFTSDEGMTGMTRRARNECRFEYFTPVTPEIEAYSSLAPGDIRWVLMTENPGPPEEKKEEGKPKVARRVQGWKILNHLDMVEGVRAGNKTKVQRWRTTIGEWEEFVKRVGCLPNFFGKELPPAFTVDEGEEGFVDTDADIYMMEDADASTYILVRSDRVMLVKTKIYTIRTVEETWEREKTRMWEQHVSEKEAGEPVGINEFEEEVEEAKREHYEAYAANVEAWKEQKEMAATGPSWWKSLEEEQEEESAAASSTL